VPADDGAHQVELGAEVVADGGVVALPGGGADLPVRHGAQALLGEQPFSGAEDLSARGADLLRPRRSADVRHHDHHRTGTSDAVDRQFGQAGHRRCSMPAGQVSGRSRFQPLKITVAFGQIRHSEAQATI
jgi:hypothetical protein